MPLLHIGGFVWLDFPIYPDAILLALLLEGAYLYAVSKLRRRLPDAGRVKRSQVVAFTLGVLVFYLASGTPLTELSEEYLASAHMLQHLLYTLVMAPLLLAGVPSWLWQALLYRRRLLPTARLLARPLVAFALFNAVLVLTHLPSVVDLALRVHGFHFFVHLLLVGSALVMWWPILSPLSALPRLSYPLQMAYLFMQSLLPSIIASFVTFSDRVVYQFYAEAPRLWNLSPIQDQQIAGVIMKVLGSIILWCFIGVAFFKWYEREEAKARGLQWEEVAQGLDEMGLTRTE